MGEWEQAMQFYETAKDYYSLVRLLCFNGSVERAVEVVEESGSKAAAYQLARRLSMDDEVCVRVRVRVRMRVCVYMYYVCVCDTTLRHRRRRRSSQDVNPGLLNSTQMLSPTEPAIRAEDRWYSQAGSPLGMLTWYMYVTYLSPQTLVWQVAEEGLSAAFSPKVRGTTRGGQPGEQGD